MHTGHRNNKMFIEKLKESLASVLPVAGIVFLLCFTIAPVESGLMLSFIFGTVLLVFGMSLFTLGTDLAMTPMGEQVGSATLRTRKLWFVLLVSFLIGVMITISEPDLQVLAGQVPTVPNLVLILTVAVGVGIFLLLSMLRMVLHIPLHLMLTGFYIIVFILAQFVPKEYLAVAFDSGGVTTGPMTVPFIMALGVGVAATRSDKTAEEDSFGLVALSSIGPILAVLLLGMVFSGGSAVHAAQTPPVAQDSRALWLQYRGSIPSYMGEMALALLPIVIFFGLFQVFKLKLAKHEIGKLCVGLIYTYAGLVLFMTGVNVGFMPLGTELGRLLGALPYRWIAVPVGMVIGYFIVAAEPAVHVLNQQVMEISAGAIPKKAMSLSLSVGVSISVGLSMLRILTGLNMMWLLAPGYALALILSFFTPRLFTAIAFDSGGVASGPMTATFLLPLAMGLCLSVGGNVSDAFGVVAMVAMTPLLTIQVLGLYYRHVTNKAHAKQAREVSQDG